MLGASVHESWSRRATVMASDLAPRDNWLRHLDVADYGAFKDEVLSFKPDLLVNLAAQTDLEFCEQNVDLAWASNAIGAENGALLASQLDIPYVYISTAGIFDGGQEVYLDYDDPNPLTVYAKSKYHGEKFVASYLRKYFILRAGWMMGGGPDLDKKFINKIYRQLRDGATEIFAVTDKLGTPTYTVDFAEGMVKIAESEIYGLYNQVCGGSGSRYDVAKEFVRLLGLGDSVAVTPVTSEHFAQEYFADRPSSEQLVNHKLDLRGMNYMRPWQEALAHYAEVFKQDLAQ
ncbi:NAD(P)-dependent oxidoreductase [Nocardioides sp. KIGAM211]|uniref:dTDP-4-dehydrorhamnose reductase n=2 Tax=Nocardioides luti TaxID=2761101 RepID=A0A7X0RI27_9ACTN|nr:NAD(P)-dependent oxidoreductase [Nocardioides luti]